MQIKNGNNGFLNVWGPKKLKKNILQNVAKKNAKIHKGPDYNRRSNACVMGILQHAID